MSASSMKRSLVAASSSGKRSRVEHINRLCDLKSGGGLFANVHNSSRAKEKGYLRSREASTKYEEVRRKAN